MLVLLRRVGWGGGMLAFLQGGKSGMLVLLLEGKSGTLEGGGGHAGVFTRGREMLAGVFRWGTEWNAGVGEASL